jgi:hypothetical protein
MTEVVLHPGQSRVYRSGWTLSAAGAVVAPGAGRFRVVVAGRRWGKTTLAGLDMLAAAQLAKPGQRVWYVAPTRVMAKDILWRPLKQLVPQSWLAKPASETELDMELVNGALLQVRGAEDPDSLRGRGPWHVVIDEYADMAPEAWTEVIRPALADTKGSALFLGTPKAYNHFHEVYALGQAGTAEGWASWQFRSVDNPHLDPLEIEDARRTMDTRTFRQEFEASFEALAGRAYYAFRRDTHVRPVQMDPATPACVAFDFNVDPATAVIGQLVRDEVRVWREVYITHAGGEATRACAQAAKAWLDSLPWHGGIHVYGDPAGRASKTTGPSDHKVIYDTFPGANRYIRTAAPHVRDRIAAVNGRLQSTDGTSHCVVDPSCVHLIADLEQVTFADNGDLDKRHPALTHISDALGYWLEREDPSRIRGGVMLAHLPGY